MLHLNLYDLVLLVLDLVKSKVDRYLFSLVAVKELLQYWYSTLRETCVEVLGVEGLWGVHVGLGEGDEARTNDVEVPHRCSGSHQGSWAGRRTRREGTGSPWHRGDHVGEGVAARDLRGGRGREAVGRDPEVTGRRQGSSGRTVLERNLQHNRQDGLE